MRADFKVLFLKQLDLYINNKKREKLKMKKIYTLLMLVAMSSIFSISVSGSTLSTDYGHTNPNDPMGPKCNNTNYIVEHVGQGQPIYGSHIVEANGARCYVTAVTYTHRKICSSCGYEFGTYQKQCLITHSYCGQYYSNCWL